MVFALYGSDYLSQIPLPTQTKIVVGVIAAEEVKRVRKEPACRHIEPGGQIVAEEFLLLCSALPSNKNCLHIVNINYAISIRIRHQIRHQPVRVTVNYPNPPFYFSAGICIMAVPILPEAGCAADFPAPGTHYAVNGQGIGSGGIADAERTHADHQRQAQYAQFAEIPLYSRSHCCIPRGGCGSLPTPHPPFDFLAPGHGGATYLFHRTASIEMVKLSDAP